ncbi:MAG TPA: hypothetical protein VMW23_02015 [Sedimentisphaerales bacterium]|nr:hypothetical protein [Sedimentisphaerales bacterium]
MNAAQKLKANWIRFFSWVVKAAGMALLLLVVVIGVGEGLPNPLKLTAIELVQMINFVAALSGLVLALRWQGLGGLVTVAGIFVFSTVETIEHQKLFAGGWFFVIAGVGIANMVCWALKRMRTKHVSCGK